jgi:hypothetical protein
VQLRKKFQNKMEIAMAKKGKGGGKKC